MGYRIMGRLLSYLVLAHGLISSRADATWHFFVLVCIGGLPAGLRSHKILMVKVDEEALFLLRRGDSPRMVS